MHTLLAVFFMVAIGALIGAFTNYLAIRMLFRPYRAHYLGRFQLPFTPGLIPKRRIELAEKIGQVVSEHLLTGEVIREKLLDPKLEKELTATARQFFEEKMNQSTSTKEIIQQLGFPNGDKQISQFLEQKIEGKLVHFLDMHRTEKIAELLPKTVIESAERHLPELSEAARGKVVRFLESPQGAEQLTRLLTQFLNDHGRMFSMAKLFLNVDTLAGKLQKELLQLLERPEIQTELATLFEQEWQKMLERDLTSLIDPENEQKLAQQVTSEVRDMLELDERFSRPLQDEVRPYQVVMTDKVLPYLVRLILEFAAKNSSEFLARLDFATLIEQQINAFSLEEVEKLVVEISGRELKMITLLGGVLGGLIGVVQGLLALLM
ncbi:DUF445 domain-containing protein [Listeria costaricensis]|uniref:DUF445 domain-containing protein n=1 Tax=Listeria costaricensis TaxID=2026604 RepID=UPI0013C44AB2|nr:DUF445 family protein [Listeria costaricensis]